MAYSQTEDREVLGYNLLLQNRAGYTFSELGKKYGMTTDAVAGLVRTARLKSPKEFNISLGNPLVLVGDFLVVGDVHVPCTDWEFASLVIKVAQKENIRQLLIAGDFFNFDMWSIFRKIMPLPSWRDERAAAQKLIEEWLAYFDAIYTLMGNHERRLEAWCEGELDEADIWNMITSSPKMTHSNFGWCAIISNDIPWRVTHPKNCLRNQLRLASDLAAKFECNTISFHEHHTAKGWDDYGHYVTVNGGTLVDPKKLAYVHMDDSRNPAMINSFILLKNGCPKILGKKPFTDWSEYL